MAKSKRNLVIFLLASLVFLITALSPCLILSAGASQPVRGDINHNGRLDAKDAMLIQRFTISLSTFTADDYKIADVNGDGSVTAKDVIFVLRCVIGLSSLEGSVPNVSEFNEIQADVSKANADNHDDVLKQQAMEVTRLVNIEREKEGLVPLTLDETLCEYANVRAEETFTEFAHSRPDGRAWYSILDDNNVDYCTGGENIAAGYKSPEVVVSAWMGSEGHRANIMNPEFRKLGVGYAYFADDPYGHYWQQMFTD